MTHSFSVRLTSELPTGGRSETLVFEAADHAGALEIRVPTTLWERFRAEAPTPCSFEDQRDHALGMIEAEASYRVAILGRDGTRTIELG
jgi:hypothetical protein